MESGADSEEHDQLEVVQNHPSAFRRLNFVRCDPRQTDGYRATNRCVCAYSSHAERQPRCGQASLRNETVDLLELAKSGATTGAFRF